MDQVQFEYVKHDGRLSLYLKGGGLLGSARNADGPGKRDRGKWEAHDDQANLIGKGTRKECVELIKKSWLSKGGAGMQAGV